MNPKINLICPHCESEEVVRDANASWNTTTQNWELSALFDIFTCNRCGYEIDPKEVPL